MGGREGEREEGERENKSLLEKHNKHEFHASYIDLGGTDLSLKMLQESGKVEEKCVEL